MEEPYSPFGVILKEVVGQVPGSLGAVLVAGDGEPVDQFTLAEPIDVQIAGAQVRVENTILGAVAAGTPIAAIENLRGTLELDRLFGTGRLVAV